MLAKELRIFFLSIKYNLMKETENSYTFIASIMSVLLDNIVFIVQWLLFFSFSKTIAGFSFNDIVIFLAISELVYGISNFFCKGAYDLSRLIINGKLDVFLIQPRNVLINVITSNISPHAISNIISGYLLLLIFKFSVINLVTFTILSITSAIALTAIVIILNSVSFWIIGFHSVIDELVSITIMFGNYPDKIFSLPIKILLYTIIPTGCLIYLPVNFILTFTFQILVSFVFYVLFVLIFSVIIFNLGIKRYSSSNLMLSRF